MAGNITHWLHGSWRSMRKFHLRSFHVELRHPLIQSEGGTADDLVADCPGVGCGNPVLNRGIIGIYRGNRPSCPQFYAGQSTDYRRDLDCF
jgi:hypothetical protein